MLKIKKSKILSLFMTAAMIFSNLTGLGGINIVRAAGTDKVFDLVEVTDFHGALVSSDATPLPVAGVLAKNIKDLKATNPTRTLIIGGGDLYQGSPISNVLRGVPVQKAFSNIGMEVTALGNHEFDWQLDTVVNTTMKDASYSIVAANLYNKNADGTKGTRKFEPYKIIVKDGVRIAFIGAITAEAKDIIMPAYTDNYIFTDAATEVNACAAEIKAANTADVVVAIIHAGNIYDSNYKDTGKGEIYDITNKLTNVDAVFGGHSHSIVTGVGTNGVPIYIANYNGKGYIDAKMTVKADGSVSFAAPSAANYIAVDTTAANGYKNASPVQDPEVKAIVDAANTAVGPTFAEVIGNTATNLTRTQVGAPFGESILGNWSADVVRKSASADIGIQNNGGLRTDIKAGPITVGTIFYFMPFDNEINTVLVTKAQLKVILEQAVKDGGKGIQISGIKFTYDSTATSGARVLSITREDGTAITDTETLKIAGPDFVITGGDGFTGFTDVNVSKTMVKTGVLVRDALLADVRANNAINYTLNTRVNNLAKTISIVGTSDLHGAIYPLDYNTGKSSNVGLAKISTYMNNLRATNPNTMLIDNGDTIQGTPLVYYYNMIDQTTEYPMMKVMGAMGYDSWTLGNHEFNYGLTTLNRIIGDATKEKIPVLSANTYKSDNTNFVKPYIIKSFNINGKTIKVGILGLTTKTIPSWEDPAHYAGLHFNDLVDEAKKWVPVVRSAGADVVIVSAHTGTSNLTDTIPENQADLIAKQVSGIDAILAGHAHTGKTYSFTNPDGKVVPVVEPKNGDGIFSQIDLNINADGKFVGLNAANVTLPTDIVADPAILAIADPYQTKTLAYTNTVIGQATAEFEGTKQITEPSSIMELVNKVQMNAANSQLSIAAPLSLTAKVPQGDIKRQDIMGVYVYENFLFGVNMTGKQLKDWMEFSARYYRKVNNPTDAIEAEYTIDKDGKKVQTIMDYNLDQLYGATYDLDLTQPACTTDANGRVVIGGTGRIKNLKFNGKLVKDTDVFKVAINNYRYNGGGGFMAAAGLTPGSAATIAATYYDSAKALGDDGQVRNMMFKYVQDNKTITPTNSKNWKVWTVAVRDQNIVVPNDTTTVVDTIKSSPDKAITNVNIDTNTIVSKDIFTAIAGKDQTVIFQKDGVTWTFNGLDIKPELIKDIDLSLKTVSADLKAKETAKAKAIVGKDVAIASFSFAYEGKLPGKADIKIFIGKDWANRTVNVLRYFADKNTYEVAQKDVAVDAEGYIIFTTDHCSDYFVIDNTAISSSKLPQTGSAVDFTMVVDFGALIAALGVAVVIYDRKKKKVNA
ncbi:bifunctional metallophosphatase/5'-nucleotidase [Candidatus Clostridium radicumherbarum]|uniref:Bifunctional metallophosphatase/5'-nucleotidase n=1 Tax=Candidatus Clostridium radicumherbarum TaxID=3381662 RepID=A0ABW8TR11_9CLOT